MPKAIINTETITPPLIEIHGKILGSIQNVPSKTKNIPNAFFSELIRIRIPTIIRIVGNEKMTCGTSKYKKFRLSSRNNTPIITRINPGIIPLFVLFLFSIILFSFK